MSDIYQELSKKKSDIDKLEPGEKEIVEKAIDYSKKRKLDISLHLLVPDDITGEQLQLFKDKLNSKISVYKENSLKFEINIYSNLDNIHFKGIGSIRSDFLLVKHPLEYADEILNSVPDNYNRQSDDFKEIIYEEIN